jgi:polyphosphate kinase
MWANLRDNQQSWHLCPDGTYSRTETEDAPFNAHHFFMTNPSLSGRGSALPENRVGGGRRKARKQGKIKKKKA